MHLEICVQIHSVVFALKHYVDKLTSKKYAKTINRLCAGNDIFVKCQTQGEVNPNRPLRTPLLPIAMITLRM